MIELKADGVTCIIDPDTGGRIASLAVGDRQLLLGPAPDAHPMHGGSYPMAPFAGRVRDGRFAFDGHDYQLELNHPPHAIHGVAFTQPWSVNDLGDRFVAMTCGFEDHWPFGGAASQRIELFTDRVEQSLAVTADDLAMPAQVGWHPWFVKPDVARLAFERMYVRDTDGIPTGELVDAPPGPWDDCFVGPRGPLELEYAGLVVRVDSDCGCWVVYDQLHDATCVEPQSGPPNGFNLAGSGAFTRLEPGQAVQRSMTISWRRPG